MHERLKRIIFKKLDQDLGQAEIIVDDNKSIWFIDRANKFWYLELRSSGTLWWRYSFFRDFFPLFGLERLEYEPVIAEWVEEVLKRGVSSTLTDILMELRTMEEVFNREVSSTLQSKIAYQNQVGEVLNSRVDTTLAMNFAFPPGVEEALKRGVSSTLHREFPLMDAGVEEALKRGVYSTQCNVGLQGSRPVEEVLKSTASPTTVDNWSAVVTMEEALKLGVSSFLNFDTPRNREVGRALTRRVNSTDTKYVLPHWELEKVLQIKIQPEETNVKRVLSLKAGVRECKMKIKKIFKKIIS